MVLLLLLLMGNVSAVLLKADAPAAELLTCNTCLSHNLHWYFGTMTGTLHWAGPHHALEAQTVHLLFAKGLKSVSAKLFKKSPQL